MSSCESHCELGAEERPLGLLERGVSLAGGLALVMRTLKPRLLRDLALLTAGGYLMYRGAAGACPLHGPLLGTSSEDAPSGAEELDALLASHGQRHDEPPPARGETDNYVDEASLESFPASDPPAFTRAAASPSKA